MYMYIPLFSSDGRRQKSRLPNLSLKSKKYLAQIVPTIDYYRIKSEPGFPLADAHDLDAMKEDLR